MNDGISLASVGAVDRTANAGKPDAVARAQAPIAPSKNFDTAMQAEFARPVVQTARHESREVPPLEKFEAFVLRSFVESMLPQGNSSFFGTGTAGNIWRSMLAEQLGGELAQDGGIGIADILASRGVGADASDAGTRQTEGMLSAQNAAGLHIGGIRGFDDADP